MMVLLLALIVLVAAFNIIGILTMMVGERTREIGILLAMGASRGQIQGIFLLNGLWLGALGTLLGSLLGWLGTQYLIRYGIRLAGRRLFRGPRARASRSGRISCSSRWRRWGSRCSRRCCRAARRRDCDPMEIIRYT